MEVDEGAFGRHGGVGFAHRSRIDAYGHILDITIFSLCELNIEKLVFELLDSLALRDKLSCSRWMARHQGLAGLGDDRDPSWYVHDILSALTGASMTSKGPFATDRHRVSD